MVQYGVGVKFLLDKLKLLKQRVLQEFKSSYVSQTLNHCATSKPPSHVILLFYDRQSGFLPRPILNQANDGHYPKTKRCLPRTLGIFFKKRESGNFWKSLNKVSRVITRKCFREKQSAPAAAEIFLTCQNLDEQTKQRRPKSSCWWY